MRITEKASTRIRLRVDRYIGEDRQAHLLRVFGNDSDVGAITAAFHEKAAFSLTFPDGPACPALDWRHGSRRGSGAGAAMAVAHGWDAHQCPGGHGRCGVCYVRIPKDGSAWALHSRNGRENAQEEFHTTVAGRRERDFCGGQHLRPQCGHSEVAQDERNHTCCPTADERAARR